MDDKLRALRAAKHQQYLQLHPEERPHQEVCPQCKETIIKKISICPATGLYHHHETLKYIGNVIIDGNVVSSDVARRAANSKIVKWESAHTLKVRADATALNIFQSFVQQRDYQLQRFGYLYGKYNVEQKEIEVHCIYEPEQNGTPFTFEELPDPFLEKADAVAKLLGFRRVGAIVSHPPRNPSEMQLSSRECLLMTREQCKYGKECVLLTIAPNTTDGVVECLAWQSSSLCQDYFKLGQLKENTRPVEVVKQAMKEDDPHILNHGSSANSSPHHQDKKKKNENEVIDVDDPNAHLKDVQLAKYVYCDTPLQIAEEKTDAMNGKMKYAALEPHHCVDTRWFSSYIAVVQFDSNIITNLFVRRNRPGMEPPTFENLKNFLNDPKRKGKKFVEKVADFHVLLFLAEYFSITDDMPLLIEGVRLKAETTEVKNYEFMLSQYMGE